MDVGLCLDVHAKTGVISTPLSRRFIVGHVPLPSWFEGVTDVLLHCWETVATVVTQRSGADDVKSVIALHTAFDQPTVRIAPCVVYAAKRG